MELWSALALHLYVLRKSYRMYWQHPAQQLHKNSHQWVDWTRLVGWSDEQCCKCRLKMLLDKAAFRIDRQLPNSVKAYSYFETDASTSRLGAHRNSKMDGLQILHPIAYAFKNGCSQQKKLNLLNWKHWEMCGRSSNFYLVTRFWCTLIILCSYNAYQCRKLMQISVLDFLLHLGTELHLPRTRTK